MEEVLKVYTAWCSFLERRAFHDRATDEELDVTEMGIRSALESVKEWGINKYGDDYKGDPSYRLERIYVQYLTRSGSVDSAREVWKSLIPSRGDSWEFWSRYYIWEMACWGKLANVRSAKGGAPGPSQATDVLRQAVRRHSLDWPEKLIEMYINHCEDYEEVETLQHATILERRISKGIAKRREREREAMEAAAAVQQPYAQQQPTEISQTEDGSGQKRKRDTADTEPSSAKKTKHDIKPETEMHVGEDVAAEMQHRLKRDREGTTVIVNNLPINVTETKVRQYFRNVSAFFDD
jgi:hypothetical protein